MRIGLVVDSACDLPRKFIDDNEIVILPITIHLGEQDLVDLRDPHMTRDFYLSRMSATSGAETSAYSQDQIKRLFLGKLVVDYDFVFCLTIASSRSPMNEHAVRASHAILTEYKPIRSRAGHALPFMLRVVDSQNLFAGQGTTAVEAVRLIRQGMAPNKIRERLEFVAANTHCYMLPRDLNHLRTRAQKKGDNSVGWFSAALGTALDIKPLIKGYRNGTSPCAKLRHFEEGAQRLFQFTASRVQQGLLVPTVCVSYGGDLRELERLPGYRDLLGVCDLKGVEVFPSVMSMTGAINVGDGALAVAFVDQPHEFH